MLATDTAIQKNVFGSGTMTLILSNKELNHIMRIVKFLEDSSLLGKCVSKTTKSEGKEQKSWLLTMLLSTLGTMLVGNILVERVLLRARTNTVG